MADPLIKPDPDAAGASPTLFADEDIYEDAGDLEFNDDPKFQTLYLARVPAYIWEKWSKLDDDAEIPLGKIRQTTETGPNGVPRHKLQMLLRSDFAPHQGVPKEYDLQITSETVQNTFVFTEQDLPGFKSRSREKFDPAVANMPARLNRARVEKSGEKQPWDKSKRGQYFRRAIPKKTTLTGRVAHELNCTAVLNEESERILAEHTIEAMKPKAKTKFIGAGRASQANNFIQPGTVMAQGAFGGFIKNTGTTNKGKKSHETKTARMPENELLDRIFACFREYQYWSMKSFKAKLQQPEVYLRETLEKIAEMPRTGRFALTYTLRPEFKNASYEDANDDKAPDAMGGMDGADDSDMADVDGTEDEEDENVKMEDVKLP